MLTPRFDLGTVTVEPSPDPTPTYAVVDPNDIPLSEFNAITAVISGIETTIHTYTVPVGFKLWLQLVEVGGSNAAHYRVYIAGNLRGAKRSYFGGPLTDEFKFIPVFGKGLELPAGTVVRASVEHDRPDIGDFEARIIGLLSPV